MSSRPSGTWYVEDEEGWGFITLILLIFSLKNTHTNKFVTNGKNSVLTILT